MRRTDKATGDSRSVQSLAIIKNTNQQGFQRCFADVLNQSLVSSVTHARYDHYINIYYASIDKVLSKLELRFSGNDQEIPSVLWETSVTVKHLIRDGPLEKLWGGREF